MSILNNILYDLRSIIFPSRCLVCGEIISSSQAMICPMCFSKISITRFWNTSNNPMAEHARDLQPMIVEGTALLFYDSYSRPMIHNIKYHKYWRGALYLGELLGAYLSRSELFTDINMVVPVPIHPLRQIERTYNQSEYIAMGVARKMGVTTNFHSLRKTRYSSPQAGKKQVDRWNNDNNTFRVKAPEQFDGKHILLVDDVYTTGATIYKCVEAIVAEVPNCQISIATLATSHRYM